MVLTEASKVKEESFKKFFIPAGTCAPPFGQQIVGHPLVSHFWHRTWCPFLRLIVQFLCNVIFNWTAPNRIWVIGWSECIPKCRLLIDRWVNEDKNHACHVDILNLVCHCILERDRGEVAGISGFNKTKPEEKNYSLKFIAIYLK